MAGANDTGWAAKPGGEAGPSRAWGYLVFGVTALAALIRFYKLGTWSLWNDESHTIDVALHGISTDAVGQSVFYPVNFLLTTLSFRLFGVSEFSARLFPCLFGIMTVPATYWFGKAVSDRRTGAAAAFFLAVSTWHIDWSQNARYYAMVGFLVTVAAVLLYKGFEQGRKAYLAAVHVLLLISLLAHPSAAFAIAAFVGYLTIILVCPIQKPDNFRKNLLFFLAPYMVAAIVFLPWYIKLPRMLLALRGVVNSPLYVFSNVAYHVGPFFIVLAAAALAVLLSAGKRAGVLLLCLVVIPILLLLAASLKTLAYGAYVFFTLPAFYVLAADGLAFACSLVGKEKRILAYGLFAAASSILLSGTYLYFVYENGNRAMWKEACASVKGRLADGDVIFASEGTTAGYYIGGPDRIYWLNQFEDRYEGLKDRRIWFIVYNEGTVREATRSFLRDRCRYVGEFTVNSSVKLRELKIYRHDPGAGAPSARGPDPSPVGTT